jgi:hypothetical protein
LGNYRHNYYWWSTTRFLGYWNNWSRWFRFRCECGDARSWIGWKHRRIIWRCWSFWTWRIFRLEPPKMIK